ncbi:MAG: hypothetical protein LBJ67_01750 [Planctomycetaceae bacterium]|nr:hypothetical protein [Planctomycetaceae bacterium]
MPVLPLYSGEQLFLPVLSASEKQLLDGYDVNFSRLKSFYSNIKMEAVFYPSTKEPQKENSIVHLCAHVREDGYTRLDVSSEIKKDGQVIKTNNIFLVTPKFGYAFQKVDDHDFILKGKEKREDVLFMIHQLAPFVQIAFSHNGISFDQSIFKFKEKGMYDSSLSIPIVNSVNEIVKDNEKIITLSVNKSKFSKEIKESLAKKYFFSSDNLWVLLEVNEPYFDSSLKLLGKKITKVEYNYSHDIPLIKRLIQSDINVDGKETSNVVYEINNIISDMPSLEIFDPKQFLPPGTKIGKEIQPAYFSWGRIFFIFFGVFLVLVGLWMKIKQRNLKV